MQTYISNLVRTTSVWNNLHTIMNSHTNLFNKNSVFREHTKTCICYQCLEEMNLIFNHNINVIRKFNFHYPLI